MCVSVRRRRRRVPLLAENDISRPLPVCVCVCTTTSARDSLVSCFSASPLLRKGGFHGNIHSRARVRESVSELACVSVCVREIII